jgi:hypothetical protein
LRFVKWLIVRERVAWIVYGCGTGAIRSFCSPDDSGSTGRRLT